MNTEDRVNKALFGPKPMQRAKAKETARSKEQKAKKTLDEIREAIGVKPSTAQRNYPYQVRIPKYGYPDRD